MLPAVRYATEVCHRNNPAVRYAQKQCPEISCRRSKNLIGLQWKRLNHAMKGHAVCILVPSRAFGEEGMQLKNIIMQHAQRKKVGSDVSSGGCFWSSTVEKIQPTGLFVTSSVKSQES